MTEKDVYLLKYFPNLGTAGEFRFDKVPSACQALPPDSVFVSQCAFSTAIQYGCHRASASIPNQMSASDVSPVMIDETVSSAVTIWAIACAHLARPPSASKRNQSPSRQARRGKGLDGQEESP